MTASISDDPQRAARPKTADWRYELESERRTVTARTTGRRRGDAASLSRGRTRGRRGNVTAMAVARSNRSDQRRRAVGAD